MSLWPILAGRLVAFDLESARLWYESEEPGLGLESLEEIRATYRRIAEGPLKYQEIRSGVRRALARRFPYGVYFSVEGETVVALPVLHAARDPADWQRRV